MIFEFGLIPKYMNFLAFQKEVRTKFWKNELQHNYKQVIFFKYNHKSFPIVNEHDWESLIRTANNHISYGLCVAFIPKNFTCFDEAILNTAPFHVGISCKGCGIEPIIGLLFTCVECANFNLCERCEEDRHHTNHMMFAISRPGRTLSPAAKILVSIACNGCGLNPIVGLSYKCVFCIGQHFCEDCFTYKKVECKTHGMVRIPYPYIGNADGTLRMTVAPQQSSTARLESMLTNVSTKLDKLLETRPGGSNGPNAPNFVRPNCQKRAHH